MLIKSTSVLYKLPYSLNPLFFTPIFQMILPTNKFGVTLVKRTFERGENLLYQKLKCDPTNKFKKEFVSRLKELKE